jgi:phosphatidate cytidylyltransferase
MNGALAMGDPARWLCGKLQPVRDYMNPEALDRHVVAAIGGILGLLMLATLVGGILRLAAPGKLASEVWTRTMTWWLMAGAFVVAVVLPVKISLVFFAFVSFLALKEFFSMIPSRRADRRAMFWAYLAIPLQFYWIGTGWYGMFAIFIPVYVFLFIPLRLALIGETKGFLRSAGQIHWGTMITVYALSHTAALLTLTITEEGLKNGRAGNADHGGGVALLIYVVFLTQFNDVAQFCWGKSLSALWGGHKVVPTVSPNKTWEGLLGGVCTTVVLAFALRTLLTPFTIPESLAAGAIIGLCGFFGDITVSALKRDLGVKDAGSMLPGHGGVLDRVNSLSFTAPLFFHFVRYLHF